MSKLAKISRQEAYIDQKTLKDYIAFFTTKEGLDMLSYAYQGSTDNYNNFIKNCPDYYLFDDEAKSISWNQETLKEHLKDITDIIEIGTGSDYTLEKKTLPILNYCNNLKRYQAVDISARFLDNACNFIKSYMPEIETCAIKANLMQKSKIELTKIPYGKKAVMFLGSTLGNFSSNQQDYILKQISEMTIKDDILLISIDTNQDEESILRAYDNKYLKNFFMDVIRYFGAINQEFLPFINYFEVNYKWSKEDKLLDVFFVVKEKFSFIVQEYGEITLKKGQKCRGIICHKPDTKYLSNMLKLNNFDILDILNYSNKMQLFISKKRDYENS